jgi:hypothetical protein
MPETLAIFRGPVRCRRAAHAPQLTLSGNSGNPGGETTLAFSTPAPPDCPDTLQDAVVEQLDGASYLIRSGAREWPLSAAAVHLHQEIAREFYRAIPPRPAPRLRRVGLRFVLTLARTRAGLAALRALRR